MRKAKATKRMLDERSGEARDLLRQPLLIEGGDADSDDAVEFSQNNRRSPSKGGAGGMSTSRKEQHDSTPEAWAATAVAPRHTQDYRSEGEQPATERNGNRRMLKETTRQGSFRAARMPKRGGRKRLRRVKSVRRKIRVSSYCVARGLKTLPLLRWLETQPNRRLSQDIRAEGGTVPQGPVGAATRTAAAAAAAGGGGALAEAEGKGEHSWRRVSIGAPSTVPEVDVSPGGGVSTIDQLEWMDSLYIDVIHSTTDLRGGIRKARDLARPAWEDVAEEGDGEDGGSWGGGNLPGCYDAGVDDGRGDSERRRRGRGQEREDDAGEDDVVTHKDVIYFPYGAVVFWGCSAAEEEDMLANLQRFIVTKVSDTELAESFDDMTFVYKHRDGRKSVPLKNDEITLDTRDPAEKLAYSCALAQSAKLFVFEERLDNTIESTAKYPQMLAATGKIPLTEVEIGRLVGQVLCEQNEVNLHSDILDTPEFFWEEDAWEPAYEALCAYLDIPLRVDNLNKRLTILRELLDVLSTQSTNAHATRLEVIIIYLVFVEVAIELVWNVIVKDVFHLVDDCRY